MILNTNLIYNCAVLQIDNKKNENIDLEVSTDSRKINKKTVFIALRGENHDAFKFITDNLCKNSYAVVYEKNIERELVVAQWIKKFPQTVFIGVIDTTLYFQELSTLNLKWWKKNIGGRVFAITGSNGKTTNKDMLEHVLSSLFPGEVHATWKNFNNHIGLPLTLLGLMPKHHYLVLEMGTNHPGEIQRLCDIACPSSGFITNIGDSHLEFFQTRENVFKEKAALYKSCIDNHTEGDFFIINSDDHFLAKLDKKKFMYSCGTSDHSDCQIQISVESLKLNFLDFQREIRNKGVIGKHNYRNMAMVYTLSVSCFYEQEELIFKALKNYRPRNNRSELIERVGQVIFLDAYNANPSSMRAAISGYKEYLLARQAKSALFVLGDMNELGESTQSAHQELASWVAAELPHNWDVIFVGRYANFFKCAVRQFEVYDSIENLLVLWDQKQVNYPYLFIKASRSLQLESLVGIK